MYLEVEPTEELYKIDDFIIRQMIDDEVIDVDNLKELYMKYDERTGRFCAT